MLETKKHIADYLLMAEKYSLISKLPIKKISDNAIVLCSSNEYSPYASCVISSIITNSSDNFFYDIVVLSKDISFENTRRLISQSKKNVSVRVYDVSAFSDLSELYVWGPFTIDTYIRLLIPDVMHEYKKVLYLDCDVSVNTDVKSLFDLNLDDYYLAATYDTHVLAYINSRESEFKYFTETIRIRNNHDYYQMGVCVFNITKILQEKGKLYLINEAKKYHFKWLDQDLINFLFVDKILHFDNSWNVMVFNNPTADECWLDEDDFVQYVKARLSPRIVHYIGKSIPPLKNSQDLYDVFWKNARLSPFYEILLQKYCSNFIIKNNFVNQRINLKEKLNNFLKYKRKIKKYYCINVITCGFSKKIHSRLKNYKEKLNNL